MNELLHRIWMLALMAWREARGENEEGIVAVMWTVRERVFNPVKWEGAEWVACIMKPYQYSSMTDPNDRQLTFFPKTDDEKWHRILDLAALVVHGAIHNPAPRADSYFDDSIPPPVWATPDKFIKKIGRLNFYKVL